MNLQVHTVTGSVDGSGDGTFYIGPVNGLVMAIIYTETTATAATFVVTGETTDVAVLPSQAGVAATTHYAIGHDLTGPAAANPYAAGVPIASERLKVVCSAVTASKAVTFTALVWGGA
jgi:hypothetical protein